MNLKVKEITNKNQWESFILSLSFYTFLQSWSWAEVEEKLGSRVFRLGLFDNRKLIGLCLLIKIKAKRASFGYIPHGPLFKSEEKLEEKIKFLLSYLKKLGEKEKLSHIRFNPLLSRENENIFKKLGLIKSPTHIYTDNFLVLDIDRNEEEVLWQMRKTTRYLIKKAEKEGVKIIKIKDIERIGNFNNLLLKTAKRHQFISYSYEFLKNEFETLLENNQILLFEGYFNQELISSAIIVFYGNSAFYHHGASIPSKIPVSYLLQWEAIKEAKRQGKRFYNFWGIAKNDSSNHPFHGITIFKKGFGGNEFFCVPTYDLVIRKNYWINYIIEGIRKIIRGH